MKTIWAIEFKEMETITLPALVKAGEELELLGSQAGKIPFFFVII